jgi:hypothetical protein
MKEINEGMTGWGRASAFMGIGEESALSPAGTLSYERVGVPRLLTAFAQRRITAPDYQKTTGAWACVSGRLRHSSPIRDPGRYDPGLYVTPGGT